MYLTNMIYGKFYFLQVRIKLINPHLYEFEKGIIDHELISLDFTILTKKMTLSKKQDVFVNIEAT